jgi:hypothetical protein
MANANSQKGAKDGPPDQQTIEGLLKSEITVFASSIDSRKINFPHGHT